MWVFETIFVKLLRVKWLRESTKWRRPCENRPQGGCSEGAKAKGGRTWLGLVKRCDARRQRSGFTGRLAACPTDGCLLGVVRKCGQAV